MVELPCVSTKTAAAGQVALSDATRTTVDPLSFGGRQCLRCTQQGSMRIALYLLITCWLGGVVSTQLENKPQIEILVDVADPLEESVTSDGTFVAHILPHAFTLLCRYWNGFRPAVLLEYLLVVRQCHIVCVLGTQASKVRTTMWCG
jgi:hypothetical protein